MPASSSHNEVLVSPEAGMALLRLARLSIEFWLKYGSLMNDERCPQPELEKPAGLFVTLRKGKELRGCIGQMASEEPMYKLVQELAVSSATKDSRFPELEKEEWPGVQIEISILSPLKRMENLSVLEIGRHGIVVKKNGRTGVYLPEVATEAGWTKEEFLRRCAEDKAGLDFKDIKNAEIYIFTSQKISE